MEQQIPPSAPEQQAPPEELPPEQIAEESDPTLDQAYEWIKQKLYGDKLADKIVEVSKGGGDPMGMLVDMAYKLTAAADEATGGEVPEEDLPSLGALALGEVLQLASEVGVELQPADMASGLKQMVMRYLQESGVAPEEIQGLQQAMNQVSAEQFNQIAQEVPDGQ